MVYENFITTRLALDLPHTKYGQIEKRGERQGKEKYIDRIFRQLLIFDQLADDDFSAVTRESTRTMSIPDPSFEVLFHNDFEQFIQNQRHASRWGKISKDYQFYVQQETKRRNRENPYHNPDPASVDSWTTLPDFSRQKRNQPWQFDHLYRDAQQFAGAIYELTKHFKKERDKDLFRAKINSILVPDKFIFALNNGENLYDFVETEISVINIKLSLDGYKLSSVFLDRAIESLHKMLWQKGPQSKIIEQTIADGNNLLEHLRSRIYEMERRFILFLGSFADEN